MLPCRRNKGLANCKPKPCNSFNWKQSITLIARCSLLVVHPWSCFDSEIPSVVVSRRRDFILVKYHKHAPMSAIAPIRTRNLSSSRSNTGNQKHLSLSNAFILIIIMYLLKNTIEFAAFENVTQFLALFIAKTTAVVLSTNTDYLRFCLYRKTISLWKSLFSVCVCCWTLNFSLYLSSRRR